ncbi:MAG: hypothetical protein N2115_01285 [bacterium]|nr:hypothetical protein [bacterium]
MRRYTDKEFSPSYFHGKLLARAEKVLSFSEDRDFIKWKSKLKEKFEELLGPLYIENGNPGYRIVSEDKQNGITIRKIVYPQING